MKTYEQLINDIDPYSKYLTMSYGKKGERDRVGIATINFDKDGKRYRILPIHGVPNCCGAKMFISIDDIPTEILDKFCQHLMPCGEMLIFVMPNLPSMAHKVCEGVGVANKKQRGEESYANVYRTLPNLPYYANEAGFRKRAVNYQAVNIIRLSEKVYFFYSLDDYATRLTKVRDVLGLKNPDNVILAISIPSQSGDNYTKQKMQLAFTCMNPKTSRTLQLYSTVVGPVEPPVPTFWQKVAFSIKRFVLDT